MSKIACITTQSLQLSILWITQRSESISLLRLLSVTLESNELTTNNNNKMSTRGMRACLSCSFVQEGPKFKTKGCPNCDEFLNMKNSPDTVSDCTSAIFEGLLCVNRDADQNRSWVLRWQRLQGMVPGLYAIKVVGIVSVPWCLLLYSSLNLNLPLTSATASRRICRGA